MGQPLKIDQIESEGFNNKAREAQVIEGSSFNGVFNLSGLGTVYYDDYISGSVLPTLSVAANPVKGSFATVNVLGGKLNATPWPTTWRGDTTVTTDPAKFNEITILFVSNSEVRIVNRIIDAPDTVAPEFSVAPSEANVQETSFDITAQLNENGTVYGYLLPDGSPAPTLQEIIDNSQDSFIDSGSGGTLSFIGLMSETNYDVYIIAEDDLGNRQAAATLVEVLTAGAVVISPEAQAVINRMTSTSTTEQNAINTFVNTLVTSGDWNLIDEFQFFQMETQSNSIIGWKGVANSVFNNGSWTQANGFIGNGTNAWINSNINASTQAPNYSSTNSFLGFGLTANRNQNAATQHLGSTRDVSNNRILIFENSVPSIEFRIQSDSANVYANATTFPTGNILIKRIGNNITVSLNNVVGTTLSVTIPTNVPNRPLAIGAYDNNGTLSGYFNADFSYFIIGGSGINFSNIHNAINQLKTDLGI